MHALLKNEGEFTEDEKYHNLMTWFILACINTSDWMIAVQEGSPLRTTATIIILLLMRHILEGGFSRITTL